MVGLRKKRIRSSAASMTMMTPPSIDDQQDDEMLVPNSEIAEGPQPMEVAQTETATAGENQQVEVPPISRFMWKIENFSRLNTKKLYSEVFVVGGFKWRVLIFPKGNNVDHLSMYLDVADSANMPCGWSRYVQFSLSIVNQMHSKYTVRKESRHKFNARESDWGFTSFMSLGDLYDPTRGYLVNDTCVVEAEVRVFPVFEYWAYVTKKEAGYVGLKNQGATCYMNTLLQFLYHIPYFRKAVYHMPTTENDVPSSSIPLGLQSLFYELQYSDSSVATKKLTKSLGWGTYESITQQDVQELNRVLCEKLEDKMKGTVVEGTIQQLFEGHHMNYIECINVDFKSTRKESFYDLQLDVKGCKDVYASFDKYVKVERLEADNKYHAEQYGLQDAKKCFLFIDFPPVLQLQLKRFEYDFLQDKVVKINDRYEFPLQLDLDRDNGKYLSPDADRSVRNLYTLHSVLVHGGGVRGEVHGGRYHAFIRPTLSDQWFKFDDEWVSKEDVKRALEEQYGGEEELPQANPGFNSNPFKFSNYFNAYILVYIRESDKDKIICNVDEKDVAELRIRLKTEQEEKEHKKKATAVAQLYTIIKVARNEDLAEQIGRDIYFDLVDHGKVRSFHIQKQIPFNQFKEEVAKEFGIPVQFQRFWLWAKRQNHTYRPNRSLTPQEEAQSVGQLRQVSNKAHNAELRLFLEVELGPDAQPLRPPDKTKEDILLFFKLYDPLKEELRYVGRLFVKALGKPLDILTKLNEMAGFPPNEEIELYEEIRFEPSVMCEHIDKKFTFRSSQLEDGDIICYQKSPPLESDNQYCYPDVPSFLEYVHNRQVVHFRPLEKPKEDDFCLELSKLHTYDDVVESAARHLDLDDPSKIRLTSHNCYSQQPKPQPIKYRGVEHLSDMLVHYNQMSDILYYEVLDIPLPELQGLKTLKVAFHHATKDEVVIHTIRLPKNSTVGDVINDLKTKVELSHPNAELRLLEVFYHKIYKIFPPTENIENINDHYWTLRAEEIPEEEKNLCPYDRLIHVFHFMKDPNQNQMNFGEPFFLIIHEGETLAEVKLRVQKKLQVPDEEFAKWKFAFLSLGHPEYLQDSDVVSSRFQRRDVHGVWEQYLGLEHADTSLKRAYTASQIIIAEEPEEEEDNQESLAHFFNRKSPKPSHPHAASIAIRTTDVPRKRRKLRMRLVDAGISNEEEARRDQDQGKEESDKRPTEGTSVEAPLPASQPSSMEPVNTPKERRLSTTTTLASPKVAAFVASLCEDSDEEEPSLQRMTPEEQRGEVTEEEPSGSVQRDEDQGMRAKSSMPIDLPSEPESREGPNSAPSTSASEPASAPSSLSSVDASAPQSIKDRLPRRLASLTSQQVKKLLVEARASGQHELYASLTSLFGLLEDFEFAAKHPPSDVQAQLIKVREATELYNKQREELLVSLAAIKLEAAQLRDALVKAEGRVVELEHALLTLVPPDPHAVDGLQLEADRQEAIGKRIQGRLIQLEAEYESFLNGLH